MRACGLDQQLGRPIWKNSPCFILSEHYGISAELVLEER